MSSRWGVQVKACPLLPGHVTSVRYPMILFILACPSYLSAQRSNRKKRGSPASSDVIFLSTSIKLKDVARRSKMDVYMLLLYMLSLSEGSVLGTSQPN